MKRFSRVRIAIVNHLRRASLSRILIAVAAISITASIACPELRAQTKLVVAQNDRYDTTLGASWLELGDPVPPPTLNFSDCLVQGASRTLVYNGAVRLDHAGQWQCSAEPKQFYLIDSPYARAFSVVRFDDGKTRNTLTIPPLNPLPEGITRVVGPVFNDGGFYATITVFPDGLTRIFVDVYDSAGAKVAFESFDASGPVAQYRLAYPLKAGSLQISTGSYRDRAKPLYGFVDVSTGHGAGGVLPF